MTIKSGKFCRIELHFLELNICDKGKNYKKRKREKEKGVPCIFSQFTCHVGVIQVHNFCKYFASSSKFSITRTGYVIHTEFCIKNTDIS